MSDYQYIDSDATLNEAVAKLTGSPVLALDTEFMRTDTFYPIPALLQFSDGQHHYLVDPLPITDWSAFKGLLLSPETLKVLHSVSEDIEVFQRLLGLVPEPLVDTQIGAAFAGFGSGLGYQRLLDQLLGIAVEKDETRSNWLQRPLSEAQRNYAALDVVHLMPAYQELKARLESSSRLAWWLEEGQRRVHQAKQAQDPKDYFRKIKTAWKLAPVEQARLQALCRWREELARELDIPRGRIIKDPACVDVAKRRPKHPEMLAKIADMHPSGIRRYGEAICALMAQDHQLAEQDRLERPLAGPQKDLMKKLRNGLDKLSEDMDLPRDLLLNKRDLEETVRLSALPPHLAGWRKPPLEPLITEAIAVND